MMLGEILIADGVLDQDGLQEALDWQVLYGGRLGTNLLELRLIDEAALGRALARRLGVEVVTGELLLDPAMINLIPKHVVERQEVIPWKVERRRLKLLCTEPKVEIFDELSLKLGRSCVPVVAPEFRIINALRNYYGTKRQMRALDFGEVPAEQLEERRRKKKREVAGSQIEEAPPLIDESAFNDIYNQILEGRSAGAKLAPRAGEPGGTGQAAAPAPSAPAASPMVAAPMMPGVWPAGSALPPGYIFAAPGALPAGFAAPPGYLAIVPFSAAASVAPAAAAAADVAARVQAPGPLAPAPAAVLPSPPARSGQPGVRTSEPGQPPGVTRAPPPPPSAFRVSPIPKTPAASPPPPAQVPAPSSRVTAPPQPPPDQPPAHTQIRSHSARRITQLTEHGRPIPRSEEIESLPDDAILEELPDDAIVEVSGPEAAPARAAAVDEVSEAEVSEAEIESEEPLAPVSAWEEPPPPDAAPVDESPLDFKAALRLLEGVTDRDAIAHIVLRAARSWAARALLMTVQGGVALGWDGIGEGLSGGAASAVAVPLAGEGAFKLVVKTRSHFLGPLQKTPSNIRFLAACGKKVPLSSLLVPILFRGRVSHLLYLDNGHKQQAPTDIGEMLILSQRIGQTVDALVERKRRSG
jgi:Type II secretion system (T2SS), protein E, N-terminal domain